jgi:hypothetical protein
VRNFKPTLRKAAERLATVHTPEGTPLPRNVLAELQREQGGWGGFAVLGGVFLAITGGEALYADMGQFDSLQAVRESARAARSWLRACAAWPRSGLILPTPDPPGGPHPYDVEHRLGSLCY